MSQSKQFGDESKAFEEALSRARLTQTAQLDAILDIRDAGTLRLADLKARLDVLLSGHREQDGFGNLKLDAGPPPRLWLDFISYVVMEPDPRSYRLEQQTIEDRIVLFESRDQQDFLDRVLEFLAHRHIEAEKLRAAKREKSREQARLRLDAHARQSRASLLLAWTSGLALGVMIFFLLALIFVF